MRHSFMTSVLLSLLLLATSASALELGIRELSRQTMAERELVLPPATIRIDLGPGDFSLYDSGFLIGGSQFPLGQGRGFRIGRTDFYGANKGDALISLSAGATVGIIDNLEAGILLFPLIFAPDGDFGDLELFGRYRFLKQRNLELGAQAGIVLPTNTEFGLTFGMPALFRLPGLQRVETGVELELYFTPFRTTSNFDIPVSYLYNLDKDMFVGARSGLAITFGAFDGVSIPAGVLAGYTFRNALGAPAVELTGQFFFPYLLTSLGGDAVQIDNFQFVIGARIFLGDVWNPAQLGGSRRSSPRPQTTPVGPGPSSPPPPSPPPPGGTSDLPPI